MTVDNTSVFIPGGQVLQLGLRRGEFIAQPADPADEGHNAFNAASEVSSTVYPFSRSIETIKLQP